MRAPNLGDENVKGGSSGSTSGILEAKVQGGVAIESLPQSHPASKDTQHAGGALANATDTNNQMIRIIGVDKNGIRKADPGRALFLYPFELSAEPNPTWGDLLTQIAEDVHDFPSGTVYACGRFLVVLVPGNAKMKHWLKRIHETVAETNRVYGAVSRRKATRHDEEPSISDDEIIVQRLREEAGHLSLA